MSSEPNDQRRAQRLPFIVQVEMTWKGETLSGYSTDVSVTGLFVKMDPTIPLDEEVQIAFTVFSQHEKLRVTELGEVTRVVSPDESAITGDMPGLGIRFLSPNEDRSELFDFLTQRLEAIQSPLPPKPGVAVPLPSQDTAGLRVRWGTSSQVENNGTLYNTEKRDCFFVETLAPASPGDHTYLWFSLPMTPRAMPVKATATVTHVAGEDASHRGMAVRIELSTLDTHIIEDFFRARNQPAVRGLGMRSESVDEIYRSISDSSSEQIAAAGASMKAANVRWHRVFIAVGVAVILLILIFLWLAV